jgi:hypothetical protein
MGVLHGSTRTSPRVRAELHASKEKTSVLARLYCLSRKALSTWRARTSTSDSRIGPRNPRSTVLTLAEEAMDVEFRRRDTFVVTRNQCREECPLSQSRVWYR